MRQGQQNRRGRGRNRKSQNPLTRSFESNGPDVKIRGTPAHIAEKYISLARDALSSGDPVLAENYLQHAEHYNRIIMAFREQHMQQGGDAQSGMVRRPQAGGDFIDSDEFGDDEGDDTAMDAGQPQVMGLNEPQPTIRNFDNGHAAQGGQGQNRPHDGGRGEGGGSRDRRHDRRDDRRGGRGDFQPRQHRDRPPGGGQGAGGQPQRADDQQEAHNGSHRGGQQRGGGEGGQQHPRREGGMRRREQYSGGDEQPEFLRRPIRRTRREEGQDSEPAPAPANADDSVE
ncbi:MAG: DUF4167 domain-containing protein [Hyphomicrobiaceae bacterium]